jgi:hypothetical protein
LLFSHPHLTHSSYRDSPRDISTTPGEHVLQSCPSYAWQRNSHLQSMKTVQHNRLSVASQPRGTRKRHLISRVFIDRFSWHPSGSKLFFADLTRECLGVIVLKSFLAREGRRRRTTKREDGGEWKWGESRKRERSQEECQC